MLAILMIGITLLEIFLTRKASLIILFTEIVAIVLVLSLFVEVLMILLMIVLILIFPIYTVEKARMSNLTMLLLLVAFNSRSSKYHVIILKRKHVFLL